MIVSHRAGEHKGGIVLAITITLLLLAGCSLPGVVPPGKALGAAAPTPTARPLPPLRLPQDEAPHTDLTEWWYYTGHFNGTDDTGQSHQYGFELTFFQVLRGNVPPIYIGHYAISDLTRGTFQYDQRQITKPDAILPNGTTTNGFNLAIGDVQGKQTAWTMQGLNGTDHVVAAMPDYVIDLGLTAQKPATLHNGDGLITLGLAGFSYYYSRTRSAVTGTIQDHGTVVTVTGQAWMDHQWGNFITIAGIGWDWFSIQLDNNIDYMIYVIRDSKGQPVSVFGTRTDEQGTATIVPSTQLTEQHTASWTSPVTHIVYPSGWMMSLSTGTLTITPTLLDQELVTTATTGNTYWEGACTIAGTLDGVDVAGLGYTELTGYTNPVLP